MESQEGEQEKIYEQILLPKIPNSNKTVNIDVGISTHSKQGKHICVFACMCMHSHTHTHTSQEASKQVAETQH